MPVFKSGSKLTLDEQASECILRCSDILKITLKMIRWASAIQGIDLSHCTLLPCKHTNNYYIMFTF